MSDVAIYEKMKDSKERWLGDIPYTWNTRLLKYMFSIKKNIAGETGHQVLSVTQKGIVPKNMTERGQFSLDYSKYQLVEAGDFVMNHMDLLTGWVDISKYNGVTSPDYRVFVNTNPDSFDSQYYKYIFQYCYSNRIFYGLGQGVAGYGRWRLPADMFMNFVLPVPPIDQQRRISCFLDKQCEQIDSIIEEAKSSIDEYKKWKTSLIFEAMTKWKSSDYKSSGISWLGDIPKSWHLVPIKQVVLQRDGGAWGNDPEGNDLDRICMRIADFSFEQGCFKRQLTDLYTKRNYSASQIKKLTLKFGDILVEKSGGGEKTPVGRAVLFDLDFEALYANFMERIRVDTKKVLPKFFLYFWRALYFRTVTTAYIKQTTGIQNLNIPLLLEKEYIPLPSLETQKKIVTHLDSLCNKIDEVIDEQQRLIPDLEAYKRSLIYETVMGKRKVV